MSKIIDISGQKFNRLTVLYRNGSSGEKAKWHCKCDCGKECDVIGQYLRNGHTKSCGCLQKERTAEAAKKNALELAGQHFGFLTAIRPTEKRQGSNVIWECLCECGNLTYVAASDLTHLKTKSCGCKRNSSYGEIEIENVLQQNNILYKKEFSFPDLKRNNTVLRFDFAILDKNNKVVRLIEFDGEIHYNDVHTEKWGTSLADVKERDALKNKYAIEHKIPLVRIPYWERGNITLDKLLSTRYESVK